MSSCDRVYCIQHEWADLLRHYETTLAFSTFILLHFLEKKQGSMTRKCHNHRPTNCTMRKRHRTQTEHSQTDCLHAGELFMIFLWSADFFFQNKHFQKILSGTLSECQTVWIQTRMDILSVLTWVQTVCKGYQQTKKVPARRQRVKAASSLLLGEMIAKLERTLNTKLQDKDQHKKHTQWEQQQIMNKKKQKHRLRTDFSRGHLGALTHFIG